MPCLNQCCCCCSLRTGGLVLGWLGIIDAIIKGVGAIVFCVLLYVHEDEFSPLGDAGRAGIIALSLTIVVVALTVSILLLVGSDKEKHPYLLPWLITNGLAAFGGFLAVLIIGGFFLSNRNADKESGQISLAVGILSYSVGIPVSCLNIYFWFCILSLYQSIRNEHSIAHV